MEQLFLSKRLCKTIAQCFFSCFETHTPNTIFWLRVKKSYHGTWELQQQEVCCGLVGLCWNFFKVAQSMICCQNFYPDLQMTFFKNCASVFNSILLYKHEKNWIKLGSLLALGSCYVITMAIEVNHAWNKISSHKNFLVLEQ